MKENIAAVYCRLSKEDMDKEPGKTVSESIKNQKAMLQAYAIDHGWTIHDFYIDEDFSGSDRERPEFNRLITESMLGRFNIVLCKKQARFARDIEYVEKYVHGVFSDRQIRFVAVLDNIDTGAINRSVRKASQINSLVDEWYLSDLSENIISALTTKRKNAEFIGSWAPFGYRKDPDNRNVLIVDPKAAEIVREIFDRYRTGDGISRIAKELNHEKLPNPLLYKQMQGEKINPNPGRLTEKRYLWTPSTVSAILHNQTYCGDLIQGKFRKAGYKSKKLLRVPRNDWIIIPDCHGQIITKEIWDAVQSRLSSGCRFASGRRRHPLSGRVFCTECGSKLVSSGGRSGKQDVSYLCCSKHKLSAEACPGARIETQKLESILLNEFQILIGQLWDERFLIEQITPHASDSDALVGSLKHKRHELEEKAVTLDRKKTFLYSDRLNELITEKEFLEFRNMLNMESESVLKQISDLESRIADLEKQKPEILDFPAIIARYQAPRALTEEMAALFIDSVSIGKRDQDSNQMIIINWSF